MFCSFLYDCSLYNCTLCITLLHAIIWHIFFLFIFQFNLFRKDRQFRTEQREEDGSVTGEYGYIDNDGKMHLTKYSASEAKGFKSEQMPIRSGHLIE